MNTLIFHLESQIRKNIEQVKKKFTNIKRIHRHNPKGKNMTQNPFRHYLFYQLNSFQREY